MEILELAEDKGLRCLNLVIECVELEELAKEEEIAALRPELDGAAVMEFLGVKPGRQVGAALDFLMEIRLEEGVLGDEEIRRRLIEWWTSQTK